LLLDKIRSNRDNYFPNESFNSFDSFITKTLGMSRSWVTQHIKSGKIYKILLDYKEIEEIKLPLRITHLKGIPFDGTESNKREIIEIWKKACASTSPSLPTARVVKRTALDYFHERSNIPFSHIR